MINSDLHYHVVLYSPATERVHESNGERFDTEVAAKAQCLYYEAENPHTKSMFGLEFAAQECTAPICRRA